MMSLLNRRKYDARWLWNQAKIIDEWPDTNPGDDNGTSVRAACDVLRTQGHLRSTIRGAHPDVQEGIQANRWAISAAEMLQVLASPSYNQKNAFPILNSWGVSYPHIVWMPAETMDQLISAENGEACVITDR